ENPRFVTPQSPGLGMRFASKVTTPMVASLTL
ncbi:unnamed protein product, partial [Allacma fusca]